jgi:hypothetical protein
MGQASKRSSSHERGLLLDLQHKGTSFPLIADREGRHRLVPTQLRSSFSGHPPPVARHLATPEMEFQTGNPSHMATSSDQSNELLLRLITEMKHLREKVDSFPTGPTEGE